MTCVKAIDQIAGIMHALREATRWRSASLLLGDDVAADANHRIEVLPAPRRVCWSHVMRFDETVLTIVDRKRQRIEKLGYGREALDELPRFILWMRSEPLLRAYLDEILRMHEREEKALARDVAEATRVFATLAKELRETAPVKSSSDEGWPKPRTWAAFDSLLDVAKRSRSRRDRRALSAELAQILSSRADSAYSDAMRAKTDPEVHDVYTRIHTAVAAHQYRLGARAVVMRTSPRTALLEVVNVCRALNPPARGVADWTDFVPSDGLASVRAEKLAKQPPGTIAKPYLHALDRVIEELHVLAGSTLSHRALIERFKQRCSWYGKAQMRAIALDGGGRGREDRLTLELAKYLHDFGVVVFARARFGNLEPDLVGISGLAVEAKAHVKSSRARQEIINGYAQLHGYLTSLETRAVRATEGFLVVFRLDGPIYETPPTISTGRFLLHSMTIDLGEGKSSGRKQPSPERIYKREVFAALR